MEVKRVVYESLKGRRTRTGSANDKGEGEDSSDFNAKKRERFRGHDTQLDSEHSYSVWRLAQVPVDSEDYS